MRKQNTVLFDLTKYGMVSYLHTYYYLEICMYVCMYVRPAMLLL